MLKLGMPQVTQLQRRFEYVDWREKVNAFWRKAVRNSAEVLGMDAELLAELASDVEDGDENNSAGSNGSIGSDDGKSKEDSNNSAVSSDEASNDQCDREVKESTIVIQGLTFTLVEDSDGNYFTEKPSRRKINISEMRSLIEEMVTKSFYEASKSDNEEKNGGIKRQDQVGSKPDDQEM